MKFLITLIGCNHPLINEILNTILILYEEGGGAEDDEEEEDAFDLDQEVGYLSNSVNAEESIEFQMTK